MLYWLDEAFHRRELILMYHRIGTPGFDPWQLSITPAHFEEQLEVLLKTKAVHTLKEILQEKRKQILPRMPSIGITFDDGYMDNYTVAKPLLEKYGLPATFFISHQNIGMVKEYWWDELERVLLHDRRLPKKLLLVINGEEFHYEIDPFKHSDLIAFYFQKPASNIPNLDLYINIWKRLLPLPTLKQQQVLRELRIWAGVGNDARQDYCCMNSSQLIQLSQAGNFEIGGHTASHAALSFHPRGVQEGEIKTNKYFLEQLTDKRMRYCAYPYGNYSTETKDIIKENGFDACFTTHPQMVKKTADLFALGRFQVKNWNGEEFNKYLRSWVKAK
ncbi:MAG: polysaccharide deacetylase family protein [Flavisolibacter sp.]